MDERAVRKILSRYDEGLRAGKDSALDRREELALASVFSTTKPTVLTVDRDIKR